MINYDSILSAFDGKPTLLQWLKLVKKALDESVLKDITLKQDGTNVIFTFNFEDGTSISTPAVTLPKGDTGAKGDKGDKGDTGVSVTGVDEVSNEVVGSQTLTTLRFNFSNGTNNEVVVHAENGGKLYRHNINMNGGNGEIYFTLYTSQKTAYTNVSPIFSILGHTSYQTVYYNGAYGNGIGTIMRILDDNSFDILLYKISSTAVTTANITLQTPTSISDTVTEL